MTFWAFKGKESKHFEGGVVGVGKAYVVFDHEV